jgi:hypothetical protein
LIHFTQTIEALRQYSVRAGYINCKTFRHEYPSGAGLYESANPSLLKLGRHSSSRSISSRYSFPTWSITSKTLPKHDLSIQVIELQATRATSSKYRFLGKEYGQS